MSGCSAWLSWPRWWFSRSPAACSPNGLEKRRLLLGLTGRLAVLFGVAWGQRVVVHPRLWVVLVLGAASSGITAMTMPVLRSVLPLLLEESRRPAAFARHAAYGSLG
jgi:urea transporter